MNRFLSCLLLLLLPALGRAEFSQPLITGYRPADCVRPGDRLVIEGQRFGDTQSGRRVVLWFTGQQVELQVFTWRDTQLAVRIPQDPRLKEGGLYEVRFESAVTRSLSAAGPMLKICEPESSTPAAGAVSTEDIVAQRIIGAVMKASGIAHWNKVRRIRFTFNVAEGEKTLVSVSHDWDLQAGTDRVRWGDKDITVNLRQPGTDPAARAAHQRWVNDAYWLLAPLKLRDPGVQVEYGGRHTVGTQLYEILKLSFNGVGLTTDDRYILYIDPQTWLVRAWDYLPKDGRRVHGTWDDYRDFGGLNLVTEHQFGSRRIWFTDIEVSQ